MQRTKQCIQRIRGFTTMRYLFIYVFIMKNRTLHYITLQFSLLTENVFVCCRTTRNVVGSVRKWADLTSYWTANISYWCSLIRWTSSCGILVFTIGSFTRHAKSPFSRFNISLTSYLTARMQAIVLVLSGSSSLSSSSYDICSAKQTNVRTYVQK